MTTQVSQSGSHVAVAAEVPPVVHDTPVVTPRSAIGSIARPLRRRGGLLLDGLDVVLNALKNAGEVTHVHFMKETAGVLLQLVNTVQAVRDNQDDFIRLIDQAGRLVLAIIKKNEGSKEITPGLDASLEQLHATIKEIQGFAEKKSKRRLWKRIICYQSDLNRIRVYREEIRNSLDTFGLDAVILNNQDMAQLVEHVKVLRQRSDDMYRNRALHGIDLSAAMNLTPITDADIVQSPTSLQHPTPPSFATPSVSKPISSPPPSTSFSGIQITDGSFTYAVGDTDASNIGDGNQTTLGGNIATNTRNDVLMNSLPTPGHSSNSSRSASPSSASSRSSSRLFDDRLRASPSPSGVDLPSVNEGTESPTTTESQPSSTDEQSPEQSPEIVAQPEMTAPSESFSGIVVKNGAFTYMNSGIKATNRGQGSQSTFGGNVATNTRGNVTMNSGNVTTTSIINSNNDNSRLYKSRDSRSRPVGRSQRPRRQ